MRYCYKCLLVFIYSTRYNNNNNNIYYLQLGCHPVAVVILYVHKYEKQVTRKFKSGGLYEKHVRGLEL